MGYARMNNACRSEKFQPEPDGLVSNLWSTTHLDGSDHLSERTNWIFNQAMR
jgi:hypothetical protein